MPIRLFKRRDATYRDLETSLGYRFKDSGLLRQALTHRSHSHERRSGRSSHYERLEFLGDSLLGFFVADWLYREDDGASEGLLSRRRQSVVRTTTLAGTSRTLGLGQAVHLGRGEEGTGGRNKPSVLAATFESVLGAIYLDGGIRPAKAFVRRHLGQALAGTQDEQVVRDDYKTQLQEAVQGRLRQTPRYRIVSTSGPAHAREFEVEVLIDDAVLGRGRGTNRKRAEQKAAHQALARFRTQGEDS